MEGRVSALPHGHEDSEDFADAGRRSKGIRPIPLARSSPPAVELAFTRKNATYMQRLFRQGIIERLPLVSIRTSCDAWTQNFAGDIPAVHGTELEDIHTGVTAARIASNRSDKTWQQHRAKVRLLIRHRIRKLHSGAS